MKIWRCERNFVLLQSLHESRWETLFEIYIINITYKGKVYERQVTVARFFLFYLFLFRYEVFPTVVVNENEEKEKTKDYLEETDGIEPFIETNLYLMLDANADQVVVEDECTMNPTELVSD